MSMLDLKTKFCSVPANDRQEFCTHLQHLRCWGRMKNKDNCVAVFAVTYLRYPVNFLVKFFCYASGNLCSV